MAVPRQKRRFALDTNILFDLAGELDAAHRLREVLLERGSSLEVPPTVVQELVFAYQNKSPAESSLALAALQKMRSWGIEPFNLKPVGHGITGQFCERLHQKGYLPEEEQNDGFILAETGLAEIPVLISRDGHLLNIDPQILAAEMQAADLAVVHVTHPQTVLRVYST